MSLAFRRVLWPTDFSPLSLAAADAARGLARAFGATLHVVHVAPLLVFDSTVARETAGDLLVSATDTRGPAQRELDRLVRDYFDDDRAVVREVRVGTPWYEICEYARAAAIDLIVIPTHGHTGLRHVLLGSVAERVIQHAPCAVLVVKSFELAAVA
jgi:nucleotide-binding universal stress UspA family protein